MPPAETLLLPTPNPAAAGRARGVRLAAWWLGALLLANGVAEGAEPGAAAYHGTVAPLLQKHCFDCHAAGVNKGGVAFDEFASDTDLLARRDLWRAVLKNVRAGLMPPHGDDLPPPSAAEIDRLADWIKSGVFGIDPANPDPGRVTARRLNRVEYRNTIRDLMGIEFNSEVEFPPDDSGGGFDNNGDVLTLSPLLLEKYLAAAETIVGLAVPKVPKVMRMRLATGRDFRGAGGRRGGDPLSVGTPALVAHTFTMDQASTYRLAVEFEARGAFDFDPGHGRLIIRIDDEVRWEEDIVWQERGLRRREAEVSWPAGPHTVSFEMVPLPPVAGNAAAPATPGAAGPGATRVGIRIVGVELRGPVDPGFWVAPPNYARFFPAGPAPEEPAARDRYAADVLRRFAARAFRRPVAEDRVQALAALARQVYASGRGTFEEGIGRAMMAVLASPRFLFRVESAASPGGAGPFAAVDEFALATRLSYFLWSTMPDAELSGLAERGGLRDALHSQVARMLEDSRAQAFVRNFTGQWLQVRDVESVPINARIAVGPDGPRNRDGRVEFDAELRKLMRSETEMAFAHVLRQDRSVLELIDSDYAFLNERLAAVYSVPGVTGEEMRRIQLPVDSPRGGVLTQGAVLAVTSNPTRTSPVKRGLFVLENILGTPPPPPPPDVPALEEAIASFRGRQPKLSEMLAVHRADKRCSSCHERMDPLGLAFENFNALGGWRETEAGQPIDPSGRLVTGEAFASVRELKRVLVRERRMDYFRCLTEKLLAYALGRGLEDYDVETVDQIVDRLGRAEGRISALLLGVIESTPFQKQRLPRPAASTVSLSTPPPPSASVQTESPP